MNQNKKRTIILPLAMMFALTGCDPKSYQPTTLNLEDELKVYIEENKFKGLNEKTNYHFNNK